MRLSSIPPGAHQTKRRSYTSSSYAVLGRTTFRTVRACVTSRQASGYRKVLASVKALSSWTFTHADAIFVIGQNPALVTLRPGALREMHWHPNADEWQYYIKGKARTR